MPNLHAAFGIAGTQEDGASGGFKTQGATKTSEPGADDSDIDHGTQFGTRTLTSAGKPWRRYHAETMAFRRAQRVT